MDPTGLVYLVHRYYDPATGQFISSDPLVNVTGQPYAYVDDDPVNVTDPLGMWGWSSITHFVHHVAHAVGKVVTSKRFLADVANVASIAAAATAFIPVVGTAVSVGFGTVALAADFANAAINHTGWGSVALDAIALIPGIAELRYLKDASELADSARALGAFGRYTPKGALAARDSMLAWSDWYRGAARNLGWLGKVGGALQGGNAFAHCTNSGF
jgi:uncharacterized protein RhaS with RHS repeats